MSDESTDLVPVGHPTPTQEYKLQRARIAEMLQTYTGNERGVALELLERLEHSWWTSALLAAPTAAAAKEAFAVAALAFLDGKSDG